MPQQIHEEEEVSFSSFPLSVSRTPLRRVPSPFSAELTSPRLPNRSEGRALLWLGMKAALPPGNISVSSSQRKKGPFGTVSLSRNGPRAGSVICVWLSICGTPPLEALAFRWRESSQSYPIMECLGIHHLQRGRIRELAEENNRQPDGNQRQNDERCCHSYELTDAYH